VEFGVCPFVVLAGLLATTSMADVLAKELEDDEGVSPTFCSSFPCPVTAPPPIVDDDDDPSACSTKSKRIFVAASFTVFTLFLQ